MFIPSITSTTIGFMILIIKVDGIYKPTYN